MVGSLAGEGKQYLLAALSALHLDMCGTTAQTHNTSSSAPATKQGRSQGLRWAWELQSSKTWKKDEARWRKHLVHLRAALAPQPTPHCDHDHHSKSTKDPPPDQPPASVTERGEPVEQASPSAPLHAPYSASTAGLSLCFVFLGPCHIPSYVCLSLEQVSFSPCAAIRTSAREREREQACLVCVRV